MFYVLYVFYVLFLFFVCAYVAIVLFCFLCFYCEPAPLLFSFFCVFRGIPGILSEAKKCGQSIVIRVGFGRSKVGEIVYVSTFKFRHFQFY